MTLGTRLGRQRATHGRRSPGRHALSSPRRIGGRARTVTAVLASVVVATVMTGVAYAYWSGVGTGSATLGSTSAVPLGITSLATPVADLFPGRTDELGFVLSNTNSYDVSLTRLTAVSITSSDAAACPPDHLTLPAAVTSAIATGGYALPEPLTVPAGATAKTASLPALVTMSTAAPDGCQARTFTVHLTFTGTQV
jgi:hypothetical protein